MPIVGNTEQLLVIFFITLIYKRNRRIQAEETKATFKSFWPYQECCMTQIYHIFENLEWKLL